LRYLLLSDLHANLEATLAVMRDARELGFDRTVVLGDLVGYGASPNEVVQIVRDLNPLAAIRGNHDKVVAGIGDGEDFNEVALEAALQNRRILLPGHRNYLEGLTAGPLRVDDRFLIAHGAPEDEDEYLLDPSDAARAFQSADFSLCFFGHTHIPGAFGIEEGEVMKWSAGGGASVLALEPDRRYLANPGSVGQPRDKDPRASFGLYDDRAGEFSIHRVAYEINQAQERMIRAGLPPVLAKRLEFGL
jgi:predicted phosphodiesterase